METVNRSIPLDDLSLAQLIQVSQGIGREIDRLKAQRAHLKAKIDARLAAGEREEAAADAEAPGAVIDATGGV